MISIAHCTGRGPGHGTAWPEASGHRPRGSPCRLKGECGVTAAHELEEAAHETTGRAAQALVDTPATTLAGLIFKARYAATHYSDDYDEEVTVSIDDLLAMADHPEGFANVCDWRAPC